MSNHNKTTPTEELLKVGKWLDDDKDYKLSTHEKQQEFARKRNEPAPTEWDNWKAIK